MCVYGASLLLTIGKSFLQIKLTLLSLNMYKNPVSDVLRNNKFWKPNKSLNWQCQHVILGSAIKFTRVLKCYAIEILPNNIYQGFPVFEFYLQTIVFYKYFTKKNAENKM